MGRFNLSDTEMEIMALLWQSDKKLTFREILDYFNSLQGKNWQRQTLRTQLVRLADKGFISCEKEEGLLVYWPLVSEKENIQYWVKGVLNELFEGSVKNFILALSGGSKLDDKTVEELREFIDE